MRIKSSVTTGTGPGERLYALTEPVLIISECCGERIALLDLTGRFPYAVRKSSRQKIFREFITVDQVACHVPLHMGEDMSVISAGLDPQFASGKSGFLAIRGMGVLRSGRRFPGLD